MLLAHALVRVDIGLAVGTRVCHILEVIEQTGDEAAAEIAPGAWEDAECCEFWLPAVGWGRKAGKGPRVGFALGSGEGVRTCCCEPAMAALPPPIHPTPAAANLQHHKVWAQGSMAPAHSFFDAGGFTKCLWGCSFLTASRSSGLQTLPPHKAVSCATALPQPLASGPPRAMCSKLHRGRAAGGTYPTKQQKKPSRKLMSPIS